METLVKARVHPPALVSPKATLGVDVPMGAFAIVPAGVVIGDRSMVGSHSVLGEPVSEFYDTGVAPALPCRVGAAAIIRLQGDLTIGNHVRLHRSVHVGQQSTIEAFALPGRT